MAPPASAVHLLRALLREATYLPDAVARQYFRQHIVDRFRAYQPRQNAAASRPVDRHRHRAIRRRPLSVIAERAVTVQKKARKGLHYLRRANQGELPCLQRVLYFAYGRVGKRKYALLADVLKPDPIADGDRLLAAAELEGPAPLQELYYSNKRFLQYLDAPKASGKDMYVMAVSDRYSRLRAVLKSQYQHGISLNRELKAPMMKTPMQNVWMRPMPIVRARNNVRRWYAETMTRLLPPLPTKEWDNIHAMAEGAKPVSLVRRRVPASSLAQDTEEDKSLRQISDGLALSKLSKADRPAGMSRPHTITTRFMRRLYSRVLQFCCKVEYDPERKHWVAVWGQPIKAIQPRIYNAPVDASLFAGVDTKGQPLHTPKTPRADPDTAIPPQNAKGEYVRFPFYTEHLPEHHPLRRDLDAWKKKRIAAGIVREDGNLRRP